MATAGESPQAKEGSRHNGLVRAVDGIFSTRALLDLAIEYSGSTGLDEFLGTHRCLFFSTCGEGEPQPVDSSSDSTSAPTATGPPKRYPCVSVDTASDR